MAINYQKILNPAQYQAVSHQGGPLLIVAGAGTGKTRTLTHRVAYLIDQGARPESILLLTFTRKAAQEMLARSAELVGLAAGQVAGGTFHALAHRLLRQKAYLLGFQDHFTVMGQDDSEALIGQIRSELPELQAYKKFPQKGAILNVLSQAINRELPLEMILKNHYPHLLDFAPHFKKIGQIYQAQKEARSLMDFDDLLVKLAELLADNEDVRQEIASRYQSVLVDEYQDTNPAQARLTYLLAKDHRQVTVVGDEAQSIYSFRGASFRNIMDFPKLFPEAQIIALGDNYRSKEPILAVANTVIKAAKEKYDKKLVSVRGEGPKPIFQSLSDTMTEAAYVVSVIKKRQKSGLPLGEMAVLFRNAAHSFELELLLQKSHIPFTKYGGRKFLESAHVRSFFSLLKAAVNPANDIALKRILMDIPAIGAKNAEVISDWVAGDPKKLPNLEMSPVSLRLRQNLAPLATLMTDLTRPDQELSVQEKIRLTLSYYDQVLEDLFPDDYPSRQEDLREIPPIVQGLTLAEAISELSLDPPSSQSFGRDASGRSLDLTLSTIHSAKGLEWGVVFVLSLTEGRFPASYVTREDNEEEERRLLYVALTRAKDELFLLSPRLLEWSEGVYSPNRHLWPLSQDEVDSFWDDNERPLSRISPRFEAGTKKNYAPPQRSSSGGGSLSSTAYRSKTGFLASTKRPTASRSVAKTRPATKKGAPDPAPPFQAAQGDRVQHAVFGQGLVIKTNGDIVTIEFDYYGRKNIHGTHARLTKIGQ
jgi:DNA helicase-2/ATP-dependent DNA helicase PcrA